jgi:hypothetical protein
MAQKLIFAICLKKQMRKEACLEESGKKGMSESGEMWILGDANNPYIDGELL